MSTAGPGETRVSHSVIDHGLDVSTVRTVGVHSLKGLPQPLEIFALVSVDAL